MTALAAPRRLKLIRRMSLLSLVKAALRIIDCLDANVAAFPGRKDVTSMLNCKSRGSRKPKPRSKPCLRLDRGLKVALDRLPRETRFAGNGRQLSCEENWRRWTVLRVAFRVRQRLWYCKVLELLVIDSTLCKPCTSWQTARLAGEWKFTRQGVDGLSIGCLALTCARIDPGRQRACPCQPLSSPYQ